MKKRAARKANARPASFTIAATFDDLTTGRQLGLLYELTLTTRDTLMALKDQITQLTERVGTLETAVTTLGEKVDAEQVQVAAALDILNADNPDIAAAITTLEGVSQRLGDITTDVESTIPDAGPTG